VILRRIRESLADAGAADEPAVQRRPEPPRRLEGDLEDLFAQRLQDYGARVVHVSADAVANAVSREMTRLGLASVAVPEELDPSWLPQGVRVKVDAPDVSAAQLGGVDAALTGCSVAIAESGTLVLSAGPSTGRRLLTLLPDCHVCVVDVSQIVGTVPEALACLDPRRPLTFISGPSATSDIELNRVEGVHGPRRLVVLLADRRIHPPR
jgi:L-lactate dehydrogenase complex protein LldG